MAMRRENHVPSGLEDWDVAQLRSKMDLALHNEPALFLWARR